MKGKKNKSAVSLRCNSTPFEGEGQGGEFYKDFTEVLTFWGSLKDELELFQTAERPPERT